MCDGRPDEGDGHGRTATILVVTASVALVAACSSQPADHTATPSLAVDTTCAASPQSAPVPTANPYESVPKADQVSVTVSDLPSGTLTPGAAPVEVEVTVCNNSPVDYPQAGIVFVFDHCSCAPGPLGLPRATADRFDAATNAWIPLDHPVTGTGMDFLGGVTDIQPLPRGATVTVRYRVALDASMTNGGGGLSAYVATPKPLNQIGSTRKAFKVVGSSTGPCDPDQVQITNGGEQGAAGHRSVRLVFTLAPGAAECTLAGYPRVETGAGGPKLRVNETPSGYMGSGPEDEFAPITLTAAQPLHAIVEGLGSDAQGNGCPTYTDLSVTLPTTGEAPVTVPVHLDVCSLDVHTITAS